MNEGLTALMDETQRVFVHRFGHAPDVRAYAPGRVNLMGEHTDYNEGFVLPCAIDFYTTVVGTINAQDELIVWAEAFQACDRFCLREPIVPNRDQPWANYVRGVVKVLIDQGCKLSGASLVIKGNVPQGAGLSSSASLEMALMAFWNQACALGLTEVLMAQIGQKAENDFVGCQCGIMDQLISVGGKKEAALLIDCRSLVTQRLPLPQGMRVMIIHSNVKRGLVESHYNLRRKECREAAAFFGVRALRDVSFEEVYLPHPGLSPTVLKRARHIVSDSARAQMLALALQTGRDHEIAPLMAASHASMRDDFEITVPPIDLLVDLVQAVLGGQGGVRMTGGGFGGCVVALVPCEAEAEIVRKVRHAYPKKTALAATFYSCNASDGACAL